MLIFKIFRADEWSALREDGQTAGAPIDGFGIGSEIYNAGFTAQEVHDRATAIVNAIEAAR